MTRVTRHEFDRIIHMARERKAKREEKRATLPWGVRRKIRRPTSRRMALMRNGGILDTLWAFMVKLRDSREFGGLCRICGSRNIQVAYHIISRGHMATRWDLENGCGSCSGCNWWESQARRQNPAMMRARHAKIFGEEVVSRLEEKSRELADLSESALEAVAVSLKSQISNIRSSPTPHRRRDRSAGLAKDGRPSLGVGSREMSPGNRADLWR